jgi:hypothetical protein
MRPINRSEILYGSRKYVLLVGRKGENRPSEPKNGIWRPKSVWSCDTSVDRKFYIDEKIYAFNGLNR